MLLRPVSTGGWASYCRHVYEVLLLSFSAQKGSASQFKAVRTDAQTVARKTRKN